MKKIALGLLGVLVLAVLGVVVAAMGQPDVLTLSRSTVIAATPADVYPLVNDLQEWTRWSPWQDLDPNQKTAYSETTAGVGAWYTWEGNSQVGRGRMTVTASEADRKVGHRVEFIEPFPSTADTVLLLTPEGEGTKVTWSFESPNSFMGKVFGLFNDMDAMLGADFEKGLARLKPLAEERAKARVEAERAAAEAAAAQAAAGTEGTAPAAGATP